MSHVEILSSGEKIRKRDVVDDLKEFIKRYEFYDDECHRPRKELIPENGGRNNEWIRVHGTASISDSIYCVGNLRLFRRVYQVSIWLQGAKR
ncbi:hypothetical protein ACPC58_01815 [Streptococcus sp. VTCC 12905]|uniref:hypothetical protein n=1 Tax=Streptococcus sp. VTCC 12905 TaxID=3413768 RepID=UPI003D9C7A5E